MTARKTTTKASGTEKAAKKKPPAAKKSPAKKAAAAKPAPVKKAQAAKPAPAKKAAVKKPAEEKGGAKKSTAKGVSSTAVNRGSVLALRPRVSTTFRQEDFMKARRLLDDVSYATLEEASRAVADRALSLSDDPKGKRGQKQKRGR